MASWAGEPRETVVLDEHALQLRVGAADLAVTGARDVTVLAPRQNPAAQPEVVAVELGASPQIIVSGESFVEGAQLRLNGATLTTTYLNGSVLTAAVTRAALRQGGTVQVANPNSGLSAALLLVPLPQTYTPLVRR